MWHLFLTIIAKKWDCATSHVLDKHEQVSFLRARERKPDKVRYKVITHENSLDLIIHSVLNLREIYRWFNNIKRVKGMRNLKSILCCFSKLMKNSEEVPCRMQQFHTSVRDWSWCARSKGMSGDDGWLTNKVTTESTDCFLLQLRKITLLSPIKG